MNYDLFYKSINTTNTEDFIKSLNYKDIQNEDNYTKSERADFTVASHYTSDINQINKSYMEAKNKSVFRREEWICKLLFGKTFNSLGKIVDYQVPLKSEKTDDGKGKIDLLSFNSKTQTAYIIEVKIDTSTESPLKAFLEVNTYFHQLPDYFLEKSKALGATKLRKAVLICYDHETADRKGYIVNKLLSGADDYNSVISSLDIELYKATLDDSCKEKVTDISKWSLKRVELGVHTNMSVLDGINEAGDYINEALRDWQPAMAITDRGSVQSFPRAYRIIKQSGGIKLIYGTEIYYKNDFGTFPFYILARNKAGLKELYKIISDSYTVNFDKFPIADPSKIKSDNILLGISITSEPTERIISGADDSTILKVLSPFDYVLLNPIEYFRWYIKQKEIKNKSEAIRITKRVIDICEKNDIIPIASDEAKYAFSDDGEVRKMILKYKGFASYDSQPNLYFRTTGEMLAEFDFLSKTKAEEIVIKNSNMIADMVEDTFEPIDSNAEYHGDAEELIKLTYDAAYKKYGRQLPETIENRIKSELEIICKKGKSVLQYLICKRIVNEAKNQGFETGSRGSVGASFVANLAGITNINPLDAHYLCKKCGYIEFHPEENCGVDLPTKKCPKCNDDMERDGYSLSNEFFWGYDGEKDLDIDLNLAPEFFEKAYEIVNDMFKGSVVRCGSVATISGEIAYYILGEYIKRSKLKFTNIREVEYTEKISKIKKKTTRHPGGIFVIPQNKEIEDYTPVQIASDEIDKTVTHFDFRDLWDRLLKIDLLMIDYPSVIYKLEELTGVKADQIRFDDKDTYELIVSGNTDGIPEFESDLAKEILQIVKPSKFDDLIKISGLTHGTGVWEDNAEKLIGKGKNISEIIAFRDDIMQLLIKYGVDRKEAFKTAERVRKGKGIDCIAYEHFQDIGVPDWFLDSCDSIRYAFPKAHAADYIRFAFILAYYKAHFPQEFEKVL